MVDTRRAAFGEPQAIASLPRPFDLQRGTTRSNPIYSSDGRRKRKRNEVVVGVDGESVNIYGIQNPRLITSYPISPQSLLTAAPCSTCCRSPLTSKRRRYTYAALRSDRDNAQCRLVGFQEEVTGSSFGLSSTGPLKHEVSLDSKIDPTIFIETLAGDNHEPVVVSASKTGRLEIRTTDLSSVTATLTLKSAGQAVEIEHVALHSAPAARQAILQARGDIKSVLGPTSTNEDGPEEDVDLLTVVTKPLVAYDPASAQRDAHLVYCKQVRGAGGHGRELRLLETWTLPVDSNSSETGSPCPQHELDPFSGILYQFEEDKLSIIELAVKARVKKRFQPPKMAESRIVPVSRNMVLLVGQTTAYLYDTNFGSVQAVQSLIKLGSGNDRRKRKRGALIVDSAPANLISWHAKTSTIVFQIGQELTVMRISLPKSRKHNTDCRLIDAVGRGSSSKQQSGKGDMKHAMRTKLDTMQSCTKGKVFEDLFFGLLSDIEGSEPSSPYIVQAIAFRALAIIFDWSRADLSRNSAKKSSVIRVAFMQVKVFEWLATHNFITPSNISEALRDHRLSRIGEQGPVSASDLVAALAQHDPGLKRLATFAITSQLSLECLVQCLRYLLSSFTAEATTDQSTLTAHEHQGAIEDDEATETDLANIDLSLAFSLLEPSHAQLRGHALRTILTRLGISHASPSIKAALRSCLTPRDTVLLINLLRIELARSGWTSRSLDFYPTDEPVVDPADEAIHVVAKLLNCCVDSLGVGGWLGSSLDAGVHGTMGYAEQDQDLGQLSQDTSAETLIGLRKTTTATLEAAQESAFFSNFLTDFLRYSTKVNAARATEGKVMTQVSGQAGPKVNMLPLGSKMAEPISSIRVDAGGEIRERSKRDIARKESQRVGRYTFERIRI